MKKYFSILVVIMLAIFTTVGLASCGSDDDDNGGGSASADLSGIWVKNGSNYVAGLKLAAGGANVEFGEWMKGDSPRFAEEEVTVRWYTKGGRLYFTANGQTISVAYSLSDDGKTLYLSDPSSEDWDFIGTFTKYE